MAEIGTNVKVQIGTKIMVGEQSNTISHTSDTIETSSKSTGRASTFEYGRMTGTLSVSSLADPTNTTDYGYKDAKEAMDAKTKVAFQVGTGFTSGIEVEDGTGLITSVSKDAPDNDNLTFSMEIQIDGETTFLTIA